MKSPRLFWKRHHHKTRSLRRHATLLGPSSSSGKFPCFRVANCQVVSAHFLFKLTSRASWVPQKTLALSSLSSTNVGHGTKQNGLILQVPCICMHILLGLQRNSSWSATQEHLCVCVLQEYNISSYLYSLGMNGLRCFIFNPLCVPSVGYCWVI